MGFFDVAKKRYSVRKYDSRPVEKEKLLQILDAGRIAPTAANIQPQRLLVIQSSEGLTKLKKAASVYGAPLAIIVCADQSTAWTRPYDKKNTVDIDASIVTDHMMLEATELGLGTIWVGYFKPDILRQEFNIPPNIEPIAILGVGYALGEAASPERHERARKPLDAIVAYETYTLS